MMHFQAFLVKILVVRDAYCSTSTTVALQVVDKNGIRDITPESLKGTPTPGRGLEPGQGQAAVVVAG